MKKNWFGCFAAILLIVSSLQPIYSQESWSLEDCITHARENNIDLRLQKLNEDDAASMVKQSYANFAPSLNAEVSQGLSFGRSVDPFTNDFNTERIMRQNSGISSSVVLFAGFQNINNLRYSILQNTAVRYDSEKLFNDMVLTISAAYLQILYNQDLVETTERQLDILKQQLERTTALYEGGTVPRGNVLQIEARVAEEELAMISARNDLRLAYLELIQLLDLDPEAEFSIEKPQAEVPAQFIALSARDVYEKALIVQPSILAAGMRVSLAEKQIDLDKGRLSPVLSLSASMGTGYSEASTMFLEQQDLGPVQIGYLQDNTPVFTNNIRNVFGKKPYNEQVRDNFSQYVGLTLRIPIFNSLDARTRIQQSRIDLERAQNRYQLAQNNLNKAIQQAHADALAAWQKHEATIKSLDSFRESFNYTQQRYDLGMLSAVEFNESQTRLTKAEIDALQARYDFLFKQKIMEFYMGEGFNLD